MALTIGEARAINDLLGWLLGNPYADGSPRTAARAREGAQLLADHAYKTLSAGLIAEHVAQLWTERVDADDTTRCVLCGCTDNAACEGGCAWHPNPLMVDVCTACVEQLAAGLLSERDQNRQDLSATLATIEQAVVGEEAADRETLHGSAADEAASLEPPAAFGDALSTVRLANEP